MNNIPGILSISDMLIMLIVLLLQQTVAANFCGVKSMIYVDKFGVLKIVDEGYDLWNSIPEETIEIVDYMKFN